ncbi:hypothetical protein [Nocardia sp. NPDC003963]
MFVIKRVLAGSVLAGMLVIPVAPAHSAPMSLFPTDAPGVVASEFDFTKPKKTVTVKCYLMNLRNEATGEPVFGTGRTKAEAQADANRKVPRGHKLKHCDLVR